MSGPIMNYVCLVTLFHAATTVIETSDVCVSLNGEVIPNHGYVVISDIGSTDDTALTCHTNRPPPDGSIAGGDWYAPDGSKISSNSGSGFVLDRGSMEVRLQRSSAHNPPAEGIYQCFILDATETFQTVYVGLYNSGQGIMLF